MLHHLQGTSFPRLPPVHTRLDGACHVFFTLGGNRAVYTVNTPDPPDPGGRTLKERTPGFQTGPPIAGERRDGTGRPSSSSRGVRTIRVVPKTEVGEQYGSFPELEEQYGSFPQLHHRTSPAHPLKRGTPNAIRFSAEARLPKAREVRPTHIPWTPSPLPVSRRFTLALTLQGFKASNKKTTTGQHSQSPSKHAKGERPAGGRRHTPKGPVRPRQQTRTKPCFVQGTSDFAPISAATVATSPPAHSRRGARKHSKPPR